MSSAQAHPMMTEEDLATRPERKQASMLSPTDIADLKFSISGKIVIRGEATAEEYEEANKRWNRFFEKQAHIVTFPKSEEEVNKVLAFVKKHNLDLAIAAGRHSYHGASCVDGGMVIDLQNFRNVSVDKDARTVTASGGCLAVELEEPAAKEGLHVVFGTVNETGIGGLSTGGGIGTLSGQYGLVVDNVVGARVVLASGEVVIAIATENQDLFWAIRGGGSNFCIITEFKFRAHPHRQPGGLIYHTILIFNPNKLDKVLSTVNQMYTDVVAFEAMHAFLDLTQKHGDALHKSAIAYAARYPNAGGFGPALQWADPALVKEMRMESKRITSIITEGVKKKRAAAVVDGDLVNGGVKAFSDRMPDSVHPTWNEGDTKISNTFGLNLLRLRQLKRKYDPDSIFDKSYYIGPAEA